MHLVIMVVVAFVTGYGVALFNVSEHDQRTEHLVSELAQPAPQATQDTTRFAPDEVLRLDHNGHAFADVEINGRTMSVLVDTGATTVAIRESDARRAGYRLQESDFTVAVRTANGIKYAAPIILRDVELGSIRVRDVPALVSRDDALGTNLLGMTFLSRVDGVRLEEGRLILEN